MESYRKYSSRHHDSSRHHKHHKHRHRHHHYRYSDEEYESHRVHQRHHNRRSSDEDSDYEYNRVPSSRVEKPPSPAHSQPIRRPATPPPLPPPAVTVVEKPRERNWKLIADPFLSKATTKVYRYDGVVPNDSTFPELIVQDPRKYKSKTRAMILPIVLPVPKFKVRTLHYAMNTYSITYKLMSYILYFLYLFLQFYKINRYLNVKFNFFADKNTLISVFLHYKLN